MEPANQLINLFRKFLADDYTKAEFHQLQAYFGTDSHAEQIKQLITEALGEKIRVSDLPDEEVNGLLDTVDGRLSKDLFKPHGYIARKWRWVRNAAAILALAALGIWAYWDDHQQRENESTSQAVQPDAEPGTHRATLSLGNGSVVQLAATQNGIVMGEELSYMDGSRVLKTKQTATGSLSKPLSLTTPNGGTYQITLNDGTIVWLNSSSTLSYPSRFEGNKRVVRLTGEAYFKVKPIRTTNRETSLPFKVVTNGQTIEVLGTEFNVSAYPESGEVKTTLVDGMVEIAADHGGATAKLNPGQQAIFHKDDIKVTAVNVRPFISWKDGVFYFDRTPLADAMDALSRWYDVEIMYDGNIPKTYFYGEISRNKPLSEVIAVLKESGNNFRIDVSKGRSILIVSEKGIPIR